MVCLVSWEHYTATRYISQTANSTFRDQRPRRWLLSLPTVETGGFSEHLVTTLPTELRGVWIPKPKKSDWPAAGAAIVYTDGYENYVFSDTPDGVGDLIEDICIDLSTGVHSPLSSAEQYRAKYKGVNMRTAPTRHGPHVVHVIVDIEWTESNGQLTFAFTNGEAPSE